MKKNVQDYFSAIICSWFRSRYTEPTDCQSRMWPAAVRGEHILLSSPTGTGKTMAAFLTAMDNLVTGKWSPGFLSVLYVSPLKALNRDIQLNLIKPLEEIQQTAVVIGKPIPEIRVETRSGDTSQYQRRRILEKPPEILITTPESLNLILSSPRGRLIFSRLKCVILDEIHNIAGNKRGTHLITALERIVPLSGEFQRIALSATLGNPEAAASFAAGFRADGSPRPVSIIQSADSRKIELKVEYLPPQILPERSTVQKEEYDTIWKRLAHTIRAGLSPERSTLIFVNSRRLAEKLTFHLNQESSEHIAYAHHGSLSREIREIAESRLKQGSLQCIVATNSLELGIDIGDLDHIILIQTPLSTASAFQKLGRAGHQVGGTSRGTLYCTHGRDLLAAAALCRSLQQGTMENISPPEGGLDVLAQIIVSELTAGEDSPRTIFTTLRRSWPYHALKESDFNAVVEMLEGYCNGIRINQIPVLILENNGRFESTPAARAALYSSGGTIPDRGYFTLRHAENGTVIGELDEEFVWERKVGDIFSFASRRWRITGITSQTLEVVPSAGAANSATFFIAEPYLADSHSYVITRQILDEYTATPDFAEYAGRDLGFSSDAAGQLASFLALQVSTGVMPGKSRIIQEFTKLPDTGEMLNIAFIHTLMGGRINAPLGLILEAYFHRESLPVSVSWDNDSIMLVSPDTIADQILEKIKPDEIDDLLTGGLGVSGIFGARFREAAGRSLTIARTGFGKRTPLWLTRLRAKRLFSALSRIPEFPLFTEAARECLQDLFDVMGVKNLLHEIQNGQVLCASVNTPGPSPLCASSLWSQINVQVYSDDTPETTITETPEWAARIASGEFLRPAIPDETVDDFISRLRRNASGYMPTTLREIEELIRERQYIRIEELNQFLASLEIPLVTEDNTGVLPLRGMQEYRGWIGLSDRIEKIKSASSDRSEIFRAWLYFHGPASRKKILSESPFSEIETAGFMDILIADGGIILDKIRSSATEQQVMEREAYEQLLRFSRSRAKDMQLLSITSREFAGLLPFWQGIGGKSELSDICSILEGFPGKPEIWDKVIFPLRVSGFKSEKIEYVLQSKDIFYLDCGSRGIHFWLRSDADLLQNSANSTGKELPVPERGSYSFWELTEVFPGTNHELADILQKALEAGRICTDSWMPDFSAVKSPALPGAGTGRTRSRFSDWKTRYPLKGSWYRPPGAANGDALDELESAKERVRILFTRYPIIFRELLHREIKPFRWQDIFKALRLMEFSGEVITGPFIQEVPGLQFTLPPGIPLLQTMKNRNNRPLLLHVQDPSSLCGIPLSPIKNDFPQRRGDTWYILNNGTSLLSFTPKSGNLEIESSADIEDALNVLTGLVDKDPGYLQKMSVRTVNSKPVFDSQLCTILENAGFSRGYKEYTLWQQPPT